MRTIGWWIGGARGVFNPGEVVWEGFGDFGGWA